jgi:hypothetical protein
MIHFRFNCTKSAQAGAFFLQINNGSMDKYLFIKMLYISDRESLKQWDEPITGDTPCSMEHGPVLSTIYDLTKGLAMGYRGQWSPFISDADPDTNQIFLKANPGRDHLSNNELALLGGVHEQFKGFTWKQMKAYCHTFQEFEDVGKSSKRIPFQNILASLGKTDRIDEIAQAQNNIRIMDMLLGD